MADRTAHIPKGEHFAIIMDAYYTDSYGDPTYIPQYHAYTDKAAWQDRIEYLTRCGTPFKAIIAKTVHVITTVEVKIDE